MAIPIALAVAGETLKFGAKQYLAPALAKLGTNALKSIGVNSIMGLFGGDSGKASARAAAEQYQYNLALQKQAQQWNEYMYKNRYQMQVEDLEKAGINKLYGLGSAPSVTSGTNSVGMADYVGEQNNKFNNMMSLLDFQQNVSAKKAQTKFIEQQTLTEQQNTLLRTAEVIGKELENEWLPKEKRAEIKRKYAETLNLLAKTNESYANAKLTNARTATENINRKPSERYEQWVRENPELAKLLERTDKTSVTNRIFMNMIKSGGTGLKLWLNRQ